MQYHINFKRAPSLFIIYILKKVITMIMHINFPYWVLRKFFTEGSGNLELFVDGRMGSVFC